MDTKKAIALLVIISIQLLSAGIIAETLIQQDYQCKIVIKQLHTDSKTIPIETTTLRIF